VTPRCTSIVLDVQSVFGQPRRFVSESGFYLAALLDSAMSIEYHMGLRNFHNYSAYRALCGGVSFAMVDSVRLGTLCGCFVALGVTKL
jgi:hypothetical protein